MKRLPHSLFALLVILLVQAGCSSSVLQLRDQPDLLSRKVPPEVGRQERARDEVPGLYRASPRRTTERTTVMPAPRPSLCPCKPLRDKRRASVPWQPSSRRFAGGIPTRKPPSPSSPTSSMTWPMTRPRASIWTNSHRSSKRPDDGMGISVWMRINSNRIPLASLGCFWHTTKPILAISVSRQDQTSAGAGLRGVVKVTSKGFVDRSGNALLFPGISAEIEVSPANSVRMSATTVDSQRVSADLMRIFLEAFFDAAFRVPAVHGATALRVGPNSQESPYPEFDADHPTISLEALARVTRDALRAEAAVTSLVGKAVRGGSVFGTQNETLAATLETAAGVMAKKLVEHEGFCYYQVSEGKPTNAARDLNETRTAPVETGSVTTP